MNSTQVFLCFSILAFGAACEKERAPTSPVEVAPRQAAEAKPSLSPQAKAEALEIFSSRCGPCHGAQGAGDGPASAGLTPKPRNLRDKTWQASIDDTYLEKIIQYGGPAVGKSPMMPPNPDLVDKPVVAALRVHIRSLAQ